MRAVRYILLAGVLVLAAACGNVAERLIEEGIESQGGDVDIDLDDDSFSIQGTDEEGNEFSVESGASGELPDGFRVDVPRGGNVLGSNRSTFDGQTIVGATIEFDVDRFDEIVDFYDDWFERQGGASFRQESNTGGDAMTLWGIEDPQTSVNVFRSGSEVMVTISAEE